MRFLRLANVPWHHIALVLLVISLGACTRVFTVLAPFSDLPAPTGPYSVATRSATWIDSSRDESFTLEKDYRKLVVQVWFPVLKRDDATSLPYIDDPQLRLPAIAKQLGLPLSLIDHFGKVKTHTSHISGSPDLDQKFPVILFSHGLSGMRFQNTALIEELVSHGYVVFAPDHTYGANITIFDDGEYAEYQAGKRRSLNEDFLNSIDLSQLAILVGDLRFILDMIVGDPSYSILLDLPLDIHQIGVMGHSLGGAAVVNTMAVDSRVGAAMILDGWYAPVPDSVIAGGLSKPIFHLGQKQWSDPSNYARMDEMISHSRGPIYKMLIPGTLHTDFTDMPLFTSFSLFIGYTRVQDPVWLNDLIRRNTSGFFDVYLKDHPASVLHDQMVNEKAVSSYIFVPASPPKF